VCVAATAHTYLEPRSVPGAGLSLANVKGLIMTEARCQVPALIGAFFLVGSCNGARDIDYTDYTRSRFISADIAATHEEGSTSLRRGTTTQNEPVGSIPWQSR